MGNAFKIIIFITALVSLTACATAQFIPGGRDGYLINDVPFFAQEEYQCGPASLASVLHYWNVHDSPEEIGAAVFSRSALGTLTVDMALYAERKGLRAEQLRGSMELLKESINSGHPPIVLVDYGISVIQRNHFMVVTGYSGDGVIVHSGKSSNKFLPEKSFLASWEKTNYWMLLIKKP